MGAVAVQAGEKVSTKHAIMDIEGRDRFHLDPTFLDQYRGKQPEWGPVGYVTYKRTYARPIGDDGAVEEFWQTCQRVVEGVYTVQKWHCRKNNLHWRDGKAQRSAQRMFRLMWEFKFLPGGRGLWMMGTSYVEERGSAALNNCFAGSEKLVTAVGVGTFAEFAGRTVPVLTKEGWADAEIKSFGTQKVQRVTFAPATRTPKGDSWRGLRSNLRHTMTVTPNHRWFLTSGVETTALKVGDFVPAQFNRDVDKESPRYKAGFQHGLVFADGTAGYKYVDGDKRRYELRLCGEKTKFAALFEHVTYPESYNGDAYAHIVSELDLKRPPADQARKPDWVRGFVDGWLAGDGSQKPGGSWSLASQDAAAIQWLVDHAALAGYTITGTNIDSTMETNFGTRSAPCQRVSLTKDETAWKVVSIEALDEEEPVYCAVVPTVGSFTLANGIYTGNCAFVSTDEIAQDFAEPFCFLMDFSMLGVGVGGDCKGAGKVTIQRPIQGDDVHVVEDTREGWVELARRHLNAYVGIGSLPASIDTSGVRPYGAPIKSFGGTAAGPEPLLRLCREIRRILDKLIGFPITSEAIVDLFDVIGVCVVAGNVRRSAIIMFGESDDAGFLNLKNPEIAKEAMNTHRWASNNSIRAKVGMNYGPAAEILAKAGEPGFLWLENAQHQGRLGEKMDDARACGTNPCGEIILEPYELCNLVETFPSRHTNYDDYRFTLKFAYLYAKVVSLIPTHNKRTNQVMLRNRRIGISQSGIIQSFIRHGRRGHFEMCKKGYEYLAHLDHQYSEWLCVRHSKRRTTVKPSGTVSLLPGVTPGIHYEHAAFYYRTIRVAKSSPLIAAYQKAGYRIEDDVYDKSGMTSVIYFPIKAEYFDRGKTDVTIWEQLENAAQMQQYWSDNSVSITVTFKENEKRDIARALELYETRLKTVSFLPLEEHGYAQAPYITIDEAEYNRAVANLRPVDLAVAAHEETVRFCDGDVCMVPPKPKTTKIAL